MTIFLFLLGLAILTLGGELMVRGAVPLAKKLGVSTLLIGIVIVGFGTSMPELLASLFSVVGKLNEPGLAVGNVVGSNIANILLILGVSSLITPIVFQQKAAKRDLIFLIISVAAIGLALFLGTLSRPLAALMVTLMAAYIIWGVKDEQAPKEDQDQDTAATTAPNAILSALITVSGIACMIGGAHLMVQSAVKIAQDFGVSSTIIGLTIVAVGTSLPELAASLISALHKQSDLAVGNIIGSNIFNALFILGIVGLIKPFPMLSELWTDYAIMAIVTILLVIFAKLGRIGRIPGALFLAGYIAYTCCLLAK